MYIYIYIYIYIYTYTRIYIYTYTYIRKWKLSTQRHLPLVLTFNKTLFNIKNVIDKHWQVLSINENLQKCFGKRPFIVYTINTNLHQLIGDNRIHENKSARKNTKQPKQSGHCSAFLSRLRNLYYKQVKQTKTFQSYRTKETCQIFHNLTCKSESLIYLLQCRILQLQYVGKSEAPFNIHLNNNREDAKSQASILVCNYLNEQNHNFQQHTEFTLIEQYIKQTSAEEAKILLK